MGIDDIQEKFDDENDAVVDETAEQAVEEEAQAASEEEAKPAEETAAAEPDKETVAKDDKMVPYGALHEEREERKKLAAQLLEVNQRMAQFQSLREELDELRKGRQTEDSVARQKELEEEFETDPIAALRKQNEDLRAQMEQQNQAKTEEQRQQEALAEQQQQFQTMMQTVASQVADFEKANPDYSQAFQFLLDKRTEEYKAIGITTPQEIQMEFDREAIALSANALQRGKNPGEVVYELAKARGYTRTEALDGVEDKAADKTLEESMNRLEKGTKASSSLTGGTGGKPEGSLTLSDIDKMSEKEFDALWEEMSGGGIY